MPTDVRTPQQTGSNRQSLAARAAAVILIGAAVFSALPAYRWLFVPPPPLASGAGPEIIVKPTGKTRIRYPSASFAAVTATFQDELFAYMMFQYYRFLPEYVGADLVLYRMHDNPEGRYRILLMLANDQIEATAQAQRRFAAHQIEHMALMLVPSVDLDQYRKQTRIFVDAYNLPVERKMEDLTRAEIAVAMRRFIRFKSTTDLRVRRRLETAPSPLKPAEAQRMAGDIIAVAEFYNLPLEFLLGIGAMENNYMNTPGDIGHTIWKRRPAKDDIIVEKRKGRYRVRNDSAGVWQITRETLRLAHRLYRSDKRDYSRLPERLRPSATLDINNVPPEHLTTYAGILLRNLIDRFDGDIAKAVGAYNGGPGNPNMRYYKGVEAAANHARRVLEQAAALNGNAILEDRKVR